MDEHWLLDHRFRKAIEAGDFDNLLGQNRRLNLEINAHIDASLPKPGIVR